MSAAPRRARNHSAIGRAAQSRGDDFERWINGAHDAALAADPPLLARMRHVGPPHKRLSPTEVVIVGEGPADYQGQSLDGRSVALEAKCRSKNLTWAEIPEHQRADLDACARAGGIAALVYRWTSVDLRQRRTFAMPWRLVPWTTRREPDGTLRPVSIGPEACAPWEVHPHALLDPRDARWRFYLAPLLAAHPPEVRLPWTPGLDGVLMRALEALRTGQGRELVVEAYGARLVIGGAR